MAKITVDTWILKDPGFTEVILKYDSFAHALGCWVQALILAHEHISQTPHGLIPVVEWSRANIAPELVYHHLAFYRPHGVELKNLHLVIDGTIPKRPLSEAKIAALKKAREGKSLKRSERPSEFRDSENSERALNSEQKTSENSLKRAAIPPPIPPKEEKKKRREELPISLGSSESSEFRDSLPGLIKQAWEEWCETLRHFKLTPPAMSPNEQMLLAKAIKLCNFENVLLTIEGKRYEPGFDGYRPADNLSLSRLFSPDKQGHYTWDKHRNRALQKHQVKDLRMSEEDILAQARGRRRDA